jgi:hypothetical protein
MVAVEDFIHHMSTKPWSAYKESDYTPQQWHDACLIHLHDGPDYPKSDCKLPVKTPDGAVNQNGVFAAASRIGSTDAPDAEKAKAAKQLVKLYQSMNKQPPGSVTKLAHGSTVIGEFLIHYGEMAVANGVADSAEPVVDWNNIADRAMYCFKRINNNPLFTDADLTKNDALSKMYDVAVAKGFNDHLTNCGVVAMNKIGENAFVYSFDRKAQTLAPTMLNVAHQQAFKDCPTFYVNFDDSGFIVGVKADLPKEEPGALDSFSQSSLLNVLPDEVLEHHGVKGQKWGVRNFRRRPQFGPSKDAKRTMASLKKGQNSGVRALTNQELKTLTQRMDLERKYKQGLPPSPVEKGKKHVKALLAGIGITSISTAIAFGKSETGQKVIDAVFKKGKRIVGPGVKSAERISELYTHLK